MNHHPNAAPSALIAALVLMAACETAPPPLADSATGSAAPGGAIAYLTETAQQGLCLESPHKEMRGLRDSTVLFANQNGYYSWCIPEYHDDQRFYDSGDYGPIAHVLASPRIAAYTRASHFHGSFINVAIVDLDPFTGTIPASYADLGLTQSRSCIYLRHAHSATNWFGKWVALVIPATTALQCPAAPVDGTLLPVIAEKHSNDHTDYPAVARFVTEGLKGATAVSARCGNRWCSVVPPDFGPMPKPAHDGVAALKTHRNGVIKGWFDDQTLASPEAASRFGVLPKARASLIPDAELGRALGSYENAYLPVAKAYFPDQPPAKYLNGGFGKDTTRIDLKFTVQTRADGTKDTVWSARFTTSLNVVKEKTGAMVLRTDHSKWLSSVPFTARWRWRDKDEDVWVACGVGCCLISSD